MFISYSSTELKLLCCVWGYDRLPCSKKNLIILPLLIHANQLPSPWGLQVSWCQIPPDILTTMLTWLCLQYRWKYFTTCISCQQQLNYVWMDRMSLYCNQLVSLLLGGVVIVYASGTAVQTTYWIGDKIAAVPATRQIPQSNKIWKMPCS